MLRPATPLAILSSIAFVLLLLSVLSTPIIKAIPLATFKNVDFGVFGYCEPGNKCTSMQVGYATDSKSLFGNANDSEDFSLPAGARSSLSSILIVHPIAAFFALICFALAIGAHFHSPSHSPKYLLALLLLLFLTVLISLLAFLVDILLFVPHLSWGGWIVLAATILMTAGAIVTCGMRRMLVSRKARKKRIAENAEMNGENFYAQQATVNPPPRPPTQVGVRAESPPPLPQNGAPMVNGAQGSNKLPEFATFERKNAQSIDDDRMPLNSRTTTNTTGQFSGFSSDPSAVEPQRFGPPGRGNFAGRGGRGGGYGMVRDEYGNPIPPPNAFGGPPRQYSNDSGFSQGSRGRGRGGYPPMGYGRGGPMRPIRGGPGMGNGYGRDVSPAAMGAMGGAIVGRSRSNPPPEYGHGYQQPRTMDGQYDFDRKRSLDGAPGYPRDQSAPGYGRRPSPGPPSAPGAYGRRPSPGPPSAPGGYGRQPSPGLPSAPGAYGRQPSPGPPSAPGAYRGLSPGPPSAGGYGRGPSPGPPQAQTAYGFAPRQPSPGAGGFQQSRSITPPPPIPAPYGPDGEVIGQAVEMDAHTGSPPPMQGQAAHPPPQEIDGVLSGPPTANRQQRRESPMSLTSVYSSQDGPYIPARSGWRQGANDSNHPSKPLSPIYGSPAPVELPSHASPNPNATIDPPQQQLQRQLPPSQQQPTRSLSHARYPSGDNYYEDIDPRFAEPEPPIPTIQPSAPHHPTSLMPGSNTTSTDPSNNNNNPNTHLQPSTSYDSIHGEGTRSPAESDISNYTSISQRGINPNWRPGSEEGRGAMMLGVGGVPNRKPLPGQQYGQPLPHPSQMHHQQQQQQQQRTDILQENPDFELPAGGSGGGGGAAAGRLRGNSIPRGNGGQRLPGQIPGMHPAGPPGAAAAGGRYPGAAF